MELLTQFDARTIHLITFIAAAVLCLAALWVALIPQWKLRRVRRENIRLRHELDVRSQLLEKCRAVSKDLMAAQPHALISVVAESRRNHDAGAADAALSTWIGAHGTDLGRILLYLAHWAYVRARGAKRPEALSAAECYAAAALTLAPERAEISGFYGEVCTVRKSEPGRAPDLVAALKDVQQMLRPDGDDPDLFEVNADMAASDAERDAETQYAAGRNYLALASISRALELRSHKKNIDPDLILNDQALEGYVLLGLGRESEALAQLHAVADAMSEDPVYGPDHPDTLACRYELARILADLGRRDEALTMICNVVERQMSSADLGPDHPDTIESKKFLKSLRNVPEG